MRTTVDDCQVENKVREIDGVRVGYTIITTPDSTSDETDREPVPSYRGP